MSDSHIRPCNCYRHTDGLSAFDAQHQPIVDGYENVIVQLLDGEVGSVNQVTGEIMESWIPVETGVEKHQRMMQVTQPDPF